MDSRALRLFVLKIHPLCPAASYSYMAQEFGSELTAPLSQMREQLVKLLEFSIS